MCNKRERCSNCGRFFSINEKYYNRQTKKGQLAFFCSKTCTGKSLTKKGYVQESNRKRAKKNTSKKRKRTRADKEWAKAVLKRDQYQCQRCGSTEQLQAHHILPYAKAPTKRLVLSNGVTLCATCHSKAHPELPAYLFFTHYKDAHKNQKTTTKRSKKAGSS